MIWNLYGSMRHALQCFTRELCLMRAMSVKCRAIQRLSRFILGEVVRIVLEVENLKAYYGESSILQNVSLQVPDGKIVCLLGRNGVGKTTFLKSIMGLVKRRRAASSLQGRRLLANRPTSGRGRESDMYHRGEISFP